MLKKHQFLKLNLGDVQDIARIFVNGKDLGILWKKPYIVDITKDVKAGKNNLQIEVTNTWWNRLVGDEKLPKDQRKTFTTAPSRVPRKKLVPAGLPGTVKIEFSEQRNFANR